ncbi:MAG: RND family transporter [Deltaproteobacteria bacterium]|nr:MAG: RND family transporter [Deltaproteobacteria bacterium]
MNRIETLSIFLATHRRIFLALAVLIFLYFGGWATRLDVDSGNEALFLRDDPARAAQARFEEHFGGNDPIVVAIEGEIFSTRGLERLDALTEALAARPGVRQVLSLTNFENIYKGPLDIYTWAPYESVVDGDASIEDFASEVLAEPLCRGTLVSADGRTAAVIVTISGGGASLIRDLLRTAESFEGEGYHVYVAGFPIERFTMAETIRQDQRRLVPLSIFVIALMTALLFRQLWGVLLPLLTVALSVTVTLGIAALLGKSLNAITNLLTPLVMVLSVAVSVNLCIAYTQERRTHAPGIAAIGAAFRRVGGACLFTTLTTMIGFGALAISKVPAIQDFGLLCAVGVGVSYLAAFLLLPPLFALPGRWGPRRLHARPGKLEALLSAMAPKIGRHYRGILGFAFLAIVAALFGIGRIEVETDILAQLPPEADFVHATRVIDDRLGGVNTIEILFSGAPGAFEDFATMRALHAFQEEIRADPKIRKTLSILDIVERIEEVRSGRRGFPRDAETLRYELRLLEHAPPESPVHLLMTPDRSVVRLTVRVGALPASEIYALIERLAQRAVQLVPPGIRVEPAGEFVLIQNMTHELPYAQLRGILLATVLIVFVISLLFRSLRAGLLAALPASLPILFVYGVMGWFGIDLSTTTSMIASVVLGLAVDSTILFLSRFLAEIQGGCSVPAATERMLETAGQSVSYSNLTLVFGFGISALSHFPPVRNFGVLCAGTIACSFLGAVFLLGALLQTSLAVGRGRERNT